MSIDLEKMHDFINKVKEGEPKWLSRKLLVTVALIVGMFWMFSANAALILWQVTILSGLWLACTTVMDWKNAECKQRTKEKMIDCMCADGAITKEEAEVIEKA